MNKYKLCELLGDGAYGYVYRAIEKETHVNVAIKKLKSKISSYNECIELKEVKILQKLNHDNIVKLKEIIYEQNGNSYLIFEYCDINLYDYIKSFKKKNRLIPESTIKSIIYQIICGVQYLQKNNIIHRDLKPENILIINNPLTVKIADFGVAREIMYNNFDNLTDYVCTRWYRAPECVLKSTKYNGSIDIWAIGCIMAELYNLTPLFPGEDEFDQMTKIIRILGTPDFSSWPEGMKKVQALNLKFPICGKKDLSTLFKGACVEAVNVLNDIFIYNPSRRPNCERLLEHLYFSEYQRAKKRIILYKEPFVNTPINNKYSRYNNSNNNSLKGIREGALNYTNSNNSGNSLLLSGKEITSSPLKPKLSIPKFYQYINTNNLYNGAFNSYNKYISNSNVFSQNNINEPYHFNKSQEMLTINNLYNNPYKNTEINNNLSSRMSNSNNMLNQKLIFNRFKNINVNYNRQNFDDNARRKPFSNNNIFSHSNFYSKKELYNNIYNNNYSRMYNM